MIEINFYCERSEGWEYRLCNIFSSIMINFLKFQHTEKISNTICFTVDLQGRKFVRVAVMNKLLNYTCV